MRKMAGPSNAVKMAATNMAEIKEKNGVTGKGCLPTLCAGPGKGVAAITEAFTLSGTLPAHEDNSLHIYMC